MSAYQKHHRLFLARLTDNFRAWASTSGGSLAFAVLGMYILIPKKLYSILTKTVTSWT